MTDEIQTFVLRIDASLEKADLPSYTDVVAMMNTLRWFIENPEFVKGFHAVDTARKAKEMIAQFDFRVGVEE